MERVVVVVTPSVVSFSSVSFGFEEKQTLRNVDFVCGSGEVLAIVGRSGCGKTTLLRLAAGIIHPCSGQVGYPGTTADGIRLGMVFQDYALFPWLTVRGNVEMGIKVRGDPVDDQVVDELLGRMGLAEYGGWLFPGGNPAKVKPAHPPPIT